DEAHPHPAPGELVHLALQGAHEQLHQRADFVFRAAPVLAGKGEQAQCPDATLEAEVDADVDSPRAGAVADGAWPAAALGPAAVAVHDDGQVAGQAGGGVGYGHGGATARPSDRHQLLFLGLDHLVDVLDRAVGDLLDLVLAAPHVVFRDFFFLQQLAELVDRVTADVADRDLGAFTLGVDDLGQFATALLGQGRQVDPDHRAGRVRGQAEVGVDDRLLHRGDHRLLPRGDGERARIGDRYAGHLRQRHVRTVVVDLDVVDQRGVGAPGTDLYQGVAQRFDALLHAVLCVSLDLVEHRRLRVGAVSAPV